jgi:hypothetical protein
VESFPQPCERGCFIGNKCVFLPPQEPNAEQKLGPSIGVPLYGYRLGMEKAFGGIELPN